MKKQLASLKYIRMIPSLNGSHNFVISSEPNNSNAQGLN